MNALQRQPKKIKRGGLLATLILVLLALAGLNPDQTQRVMSVIAPVPPGYYAVTEFVDGDTVRLDMNGTTETIRFIGIDTPEKNHPKKPVQCFAEAASLHMKELIGTEPVRVEADPTNANRDRYDRLLRYVYLPDGTLLNAQQIQDGYAFAYLAFPFEKSDEFKALEDEARTANRGLWNACEVFIENGQVSTEPSR